MSDLQTALARILSSFSEESTVYVGILHEFADAVGADYALLRRISETGRIVVDRYIKKDAPVTERLGLLESALLESVSAIQESGWAIISSAETKKKRRNRFTGSSSARRKEPSIDRKSKWRETGWRSLSRWSRRG